MKAKKRSVDGSGSPFESSEHDKETKAFPSFNLLSGAMTSRKVYGLLAVVVVIVAAGVFLSLLRMTPNDRYQAADRVRSALHLTSTNPVVSVERIIVDGGVPQNSNFRVTRTSRVYEVQPNITCFMPGCRSRNNLQAYRECSDDIATQYNTLGVRSMERYVSDRPEIYNTEQQLLKDAKAYFSSAIELDQSCTQAMINLGLVQLKLGELDDSLATFQQALLSTTSAYDQARIQVFSGLAIEAKYNDRARAARDHYDKARELDRDVERQYWGVLVTVSPRKELYHYGYNEMVGPLIDFVLYKYFAAVSISNYALLAPRTQDTFIERSWGVYRKVIPPFVLSAFQRCYSDLISKKHLHFGDSQSKRYVGYNDRCGRFIQYHITDLMRTIVAHDVKPSYTYFGGYRAGAELKSHNDREQCEFTMSLTIDQKPSNLSWSLALIDFNNQEQVANLDTGDSLIFMGRILKHYRLGVLKKDQELNQIFMHYVNDKFTGSLN